MWKTKSEDTRCKVCFFVKFVSKQLNFERVSGKFGDFLDIFKLNSDFSTFPKFGQILIIFESPKFQTLNEYMIKKRENE